MEQLIDMSKLTYEKAVSMFPNQKDDMAKCECGGVMLRCECGCGMFRCTRYCKG